MKKLLVLILSFGFLLATTGMAQATLFEFTFDPNDFFDLTGFQIPDEGDTDNPADNKATQLNPRRLHDVWASTFYQTFDDYLASGTQQPDSYNTYMNWRDGLGADEGLSRFNIWLRDNTAAQSWGERVVSNESYVPSATAADGWNVQVISNPWGPGYLVEWWTDDSSEYLRPTSETGGDGADIGLFSFTTDALFDSDLDGVGDTELVEGLGYRIWFGGGNAENDYSVHFDADWGTNYSPSYDAFAAGDNSGWEGVLEVKGTIVPEPATMLLLGSGLIGLAGFSRKKFFKR